VEDVDFLHAIVGLVATAGGLAVLIEPSFAARIGGWRGPRWFGACCLSAGVALVLAACADSLHPGPLHATGLAGGALSALAAVLVAHVGRPYWDTEHRAG
jgi:hypothetical protein